MRRITSCSRENILRWNDCCCGGKKACNQLELSVKKEIYVVGIGPGEKDKMTHEAYKVLEKSDVLVGYTLYVELVKEIFTVKEFL